MTGNLAGLPTIGEVQAHLTHSRRLLVLGKLPGPSLRLECGHISKTQRFSYYVECEECVKKYSMMLQLLTELHQ